MNETYIKPEITVEEFTKYFNNAVRRLKKLKCNSMEFIAGGGYYNVPEKFYLSLIGTTRLRRYNLYPIERYGCVVGILFLRKPCTKFKQLMSWIDKYGTKNFSSSHVETALYVADVCGKRGKWSVEDERRKDYFCHNDKWCEKVKSTLQKLRNTYDKIYVSIETIEEFENMEESIRNETELYGCVLHTLHFRVVTPGGKVKFDSDIY